MLDYLIKNAAILDGTGARAYTGCIGIQDGRIRLCSASAAARQVIEAGGLHVSPGFIDAHSHGDQVIGQYPMMLSKVSQGITTQIAGQCGGSIFPVSPERMGLLKDFVSIGTYEFPAEMAEWTSFRRFAAYADRTPMAVNMKTFTGHSSLRIAVMGFDERAPSAAEMERMKDLLRESMENGSMGLSTGLIYPPGSYSRTEELIELAKVLQPYGGIYASHIRGESDRVEDAVREALEIGRQAGVPVEISHHKICGRQNFGKSEKTLALVHEAIGQGVRVTIDQYPYTANSTHMNIVIPPDYFEKGGIEGMLAFLRDPEARKEIRRRMQQDGSYDNFYLNAGGFDGILISGCAKTPESDGLTVSEYARRKGQEAFDAFFDLLLANDGKVNGVFFCIDEGDNCRIIQDPNTCIGTDGTCRTLAEQTHPRTFGAFPRAIRRYVKELGLLSLEEMIHKITGFAAERCGLYDRGVIAEGKAADLVVFDFAALRDAADYTNSLALSEGIRYVFVNGQLAYQDGAVTEARAGKFLRHQGIGLG